MTFTVLEPLESIFRPAISIKVVEVAKKYNQPEGKPITHVPEYTKPGGPNNYVCTLNDRSWTQGFFAGLLWLLVERIRLLPESVDPVYSEDAIISLAKRWQESFRHLARPAPNHDQGFRFQLSYGFDLALTGSSDARDVLIEAADSLVDRYNPTVGMTRSWDALRPQQEGRPVYGEHNQNEHFLVIIDNMMNLDLLFQATELTGNDNYAKIAISQAETSKTSFIRSDYSTCHVCNFDPKTGKLLERFTHQGLADDSCWARGQAWAVYGYAQCYLRTGREDFLVTAHKLAEYFLNNLAPTGVPWWDFAAPRPCVYDASAGCVAARGLQLLFKALLPSKPEEAQRYLKASKELIASIVRECYTPEATLKGSKVDFGKDGWETVLQHSTIAGNPRMGFTVMDHGLVYADYYLLEYGNDLLKLRKEGLDI